MITIRNAEPAELELIRNQRIKAYEEHIPSIPQDHWEAIKSSLSSTADVQEGAELLVVVEEEQVIGSVAIFPAKSDAYKGFMDSMEYPEIRMLAVDPAAQNKGVAKALINECIRCAKENGESYIGLHTADFMKTAMRLYERLGFERMPEFDFVPADEDGITVKAFRLSLE